MTDTMMHFLACFGITLIVFYHYYCVEFAVIATAKHYGKLSKKQMGELLKRTIANSIIKAFTIGIIAGVGKEFYDLFFSDPQLKDLLFDLFGCLVACVLIIITGAIHIERSYLHE